MTVESKLGRWLARWMMRAEAAGGIIRLASLGITAISTTLVAMHTFGYGEYAKPLIAVLVLGGVVFAYLYTEGGIWNQKNRDRMDTGDNFAGPGMLMGSMIQARAFARALEAHENQDNPVEAAEEAVIEQWQAYRNGFEIDELEGHGRESDD